MLNNIAAIVGGASAPAGDYESIATVTVGVGGAASVDFTSIAGTYKHLQIRGIGRITSGSYAQVLFRLNGITTNTYGGHYLFGDGSTTSTTANLSTSATLGGVISGSSQTSGIFGALVTDILDYTNTNKLKTIRTFSGVDGNGSGYSWLSSGLNGATTAVTSVTLIPESSTFAQNTTFALYGVK